MNQINHWQFEDQNEEDENIINNSNVNPPNIYGYGHQKYYQHVVDSILNNSPNIIDGVSGRKSLELITSIYKSINTGKSQKINYI